MIVAYAGLAALLGLSAAHRAWQLARWAALRGRAPVVTAEATAWRPRVTVQIPTYNERDVVARAIAAAAALDWPRDRLEVQVLDDSDDDTVDRAQAAVVAARAAGVDIAHLRRSTRDGFKAGALAAGTRVATGELIAVFDADFVPPPDALRALVPHLHAPGVGMAQARWGHLDVAGPLRAAQAALLDGHFRVVQHGRWASGAWLNFNGTAGVWRREAIDAGGGWSGRTLTEDLDLSYRAQLAGWRFVYVDSVVVPAELPGDWAALRAQQRRGAIGTTQVLRRLGRAILFSGAPLGTRAEALGHLASHLAWLPALALTLLLPWVLWARGAATTPGWADVLVALALPLASVAHYAAASPARTWGRVPLAFLVVMGLTASQAVAVLRALITEGGAFVRTPKSGEGRGSYRSVDAPWLERGMAVWTAAGLGVAVWTGAWLHVPLLALGAVAYAWAGFSRFNGR